MVSGFPPDSRADAALDARVPAFLDAPALNSTGLELARVRIATTCNS